MLRADKERIVAELAERLRAADTLLVADYRGLTHKELDGVRTELLKSGASFSVVKNTLTKRAAEAAGVDGLEALLDGPTAIAFVSDGDMVAVAKTLADTAQQTRRMSLRGGLLNGNAIGADAVRELATLPPEEVLRAQLLGAIVGPASAVVSIFAAPLRDFAALIDARMHQLEESGGPQAEAAAAPAPEAGRGEAERAPQPSEAQQAPEATEGTPEATEGESETEDESEKAPEEV